MTSEEVLSVIKSRGFWRINFEPLTYVKDALPLPKCRDLIENNSLHLRGWDYPHFPRKISDSSKLEVGTNYWQGWLDWKGEAHKELWRMYQSSQFIHYLALREDWIDGLRLSNIFSTDSEIKPGMGIGVIGTTYQITEIFEFLARLMTEGLYLSGVKVNITLHNTKDRELFVDDPRRIGFFENRKTSAKEISFEKTLFQEEIIDSTREAFHAIVFFFERFGWDSPNLEVIKNDQEKFLSGKF